MSQLHHQGSKTHIISTSTIKVESNSRINLTPWDLELLFVEYSQKGLLFRHPTPPQEAAVISKSGAASLIDHLKASLERTLQFFPPLAGRLASTTPDGGGAISFFIDGNNKEEDGGALFIHANTNLTVADILDSTYVPEIVHSFFPLNGVRNHDGVSRPLLAVQATELADGLFIGCSINHLLVDGTSFWHFFNSWAEISCGEIALSKLPFLDRDLVNLDLTESATISIGAQHFIHENKPDAQRPTLKERVFLFTKENIAKLKTRANQEVVESNGKISSLQALVAHVWRSIIRCRFYINSLSTDQQTTTFDIPIGARQRLNPPLPEEYFGNAVFPGNTTLEVGKMVENGLGWTAWQINRMLASNNGGERVRELYLSWIKKPNFNEFNDAPSNFYILINSPRFNIYGNDLGWGKPVAARSGEANRFDGRITIFRGLEEGNMEIEACLAPETLSALAEDAEFMQYVA